MAKQLSDTQLLILSAAAQRPGNVALPLPPSLRGGAAKKVVDALITKGFLHEIEHTKAAPDPAPIWRDHDNQYLTLVATNDGLRAIGVEPEGADGATDAPAKDAARDATASAEDAPDAPTSPDAAKAPKTRAGTKQAQLIDMLRAPDGASIDEIAAALGWRPHTVRGAIAGALKKKLGLDVQSEKVDGRGTVYRLPAEG